MNDDNLAGRALARTTFGAQTVLSQGYTAACLPNAGARNFASGPKEARVLSHRR
jgi:hypothetical protein